MNTSEPDVQGCTASPPGRGTIDIAAQRCSFATGHPFVLMYQRHGIGTYYRRIHEKFCLHDWSRSGIHFPISTRRVVFGLTIGAAICSVWSSHMVSYSCVLRRYGRILFFGWEQFPLNAQQVHWLVSHDYIAFSDDITFVKIKSSRSPDFRLKLGSWVACEGVSESEISKQSFQFNPIC